MAHPGNSRILWVHFYHTIKNYATIIVYLLARVLYVYMTFQSSYGQGEKSHKNPDDRRDSMQMKLIESSEAIGEVGKSATSSSNRLIPWVHFGSAL
jgi:hypothetical protein